MSDHSTPPDPDKLDDLSSRIKKAQAANEPPKAPDRGNQTAMAIAIRMSVELVSGLVVGGFLGWWLDRWLGTKPLMLLSFFLLGAVAGMLNVYRAAMSMQKAAEQDAEDEKKDQK